MAESGIAALYSRCARDYDTDVGHFERFGVRLIDLAAPEPGEHVLDVAAGRGACLFPAADAVGPHGAVHGVDLSRAMVEYLAADIAATGLRHASATQMDAQALTLPDAAYDVVTCAYALFIMPDPHAVASELFRVVRPGGRCAVSVPAGRVTPGDDERVNELYAAYMMRAAAPAPRACGFGMDVGGLLTGAGFIDVQVRQEEQILVFRDRRAWWDWAWATGARRLYESLPGDLIDDLRAEIFTLLESSLIPQGLPATSRAILATAVRPAG